VDEPVISLSPAGAGPFGFFFAVIAAVVLIAAWVILAASRFTQGGIVERPERVPQLYGYTVCLVGLIWSIISVLSIVGSVLTLSAPELRGSMEFGWEPSVSSFEAFRSTYDRARQFGTPDSRQGVVDTLPEAELRRRYESLRADHVQRVRFDAHREIVIGALSLVISAALFVFHWRWLRRRASGWVAASAASTSPSL
jgi:hypothetical protein